MVVVPVLVSIDVALFLVDYRSEDENDNNISMIERKFYRRWFHLCLFPLSIDCIDLARFQFRNFEKKMMIN